MVQTVALTDQEIMMMKIDPAVEADLLISHRNPAVHQAEADHTKAKADDKLDIGYIRGKGTITVPFFIV